MKPRPISQSIKRQIQRQIHKIDIKPLMPTPKSSVSSQETTQLSQGETIDKLLLPYLQSVLGNRIINGIEIIKLKDSDPMDVFVTNGSAFFNIDYYVQVPGGETLTITSGAADKWVYIYLTREGEFEINEEPPFANDNVDRIQLAIIWVKAGATTITQKEIIDYRPIGLASIVDLYNVKNNLLAIRNVVLFSMIDEYIQVIPDNLPGQPQIKIVSDNNRVYWQGSVVIFPEKILEITLPESGEETKDYYIVPIFKIIPDVAAVYEVDYLQVETTESLASYQFVLAKIKGVTHLTTEITSSMIEILGYQKLKEDYINYPLEFRKVGEIEDGAIDFPQIVQYKGKIHRAVIYLGAFSGDSGVGSASLSVDIKINGEIIANFEIDYDEENETQIAKDYLLEDLLLSGENANVDPRDVIEVEVQLNADSGDSFTIEDLSIKLLCSK